MRFVELTCVLVAVDSYLVFLGAFGLVLIFPVSVPSIQSVASFSLTSPSDFSSMSYAETPCLVAYGSKSAGSLCSGLCISVRPRSLLRLWKTRLSSLLPHFQLVQLLSLPLSQGFCAILLVRNAMVPICCAQFIPL